MSASNQRYTEVKQPEQQPSQGTTEENLSEKIVVVTNMPLNENTIQYQTCQEIAEAIFKNLSQSESVDPVVGMICVELESGNKQLIISISGGKSGDRNIVQNICQSSEWKDNIRRWIPIIGEIRFAPPGKKNEFGYDTRRISEESYRIGTVESKKDIHLKSYGIFGNRIFYKKAANKLDEVNLNETDRELVGKYVFAVLEGKLLKKGGQEQKVNQQQQNNLLDEIRKKIINRHQNTNRYRCAEPASAGAVQALINKSKQESDTIIHIGEVYFLRIEAYNKIKSFYPNEFENKIKKLPFDSIALTYDYESKQLKIAAWVSDNIVTESFDLKNVKDLTWLEEIYNKGGSDKVVSIQNLMQMLPDSSQIKQQYIQGVILSIESCSECQERSERDVYQPTQIFSNGDFAFPIVSFLEEEEQQLQNLSLSSDAHTSGPQLNNQPQPDVSDPVSNNSAQLSDSKNEPLDMQKLGSTNNNEASEQTEQPKKILWTSFFKPNTGPLPSNTSINPNKPKQSGSD